MTDKELDELEARLRFEAKTQHEQNPTTRSLELYSEWLAANAIAELRKEKADLVGALREADTTILSIDVSCMPPGYGEERQKIRNAHHIIDAALKGKETP